MQLGGKEGYLSLSFGEYRSAAGVWSDTMVLE